LWAIISVRDPKRAAGSLSEIFTFDNEFVIRQVSNSERLRWFAAEVLIIITGILIALAIDEWRQNNENNNIEREYVQQLITDLETTEESITESSTEASAGDESIGKLVDAFRTDESISSERLIGLIYGSGGYYNPAPILGTIDALVATGDLRLIRDESTRSAITQYLSYSRDVLLTPIYDLEERYGENVKELLSLAAADGILYSQGRLDLARGTRPDVEAFLANRQAYVLVLGMVELRGHFAWYRDQVYSTAKELRERLEEESN
jgi:hypothetical protein